MLSERIYIVSYDISSPKRWRRVYKTMCDFGEWIQLSVFQCRLSKQRRLELEIQLRKIVNSNEDHVILIDIGAADSAKVAIQSIGESYKVIERKAIVI